MKRKRGNVKSKHKLAPVCDLDEVIQSVVRATTHEWSLDGRYEVEEGVEIGTAEKSSNKRSQQASGQNVNGAEAMLEDGTSPFVESNVVASSNFSKKARSKLINSSSGVSPLSSGALQVHDERSQQKEPTLTHQDPRYSNQELKTALKVIRKVMKMDAAAPFNLPVDPVALGIPDYLDVIETPMDFSTVCINLENGLRYQNSKDVYRDVQYIWENCIKYNRKGHYILELMKRVKKKFMMLWNEAGLFADQQLEVNGYSRLPTTKSTWTCSIYGHKSSLGALADHAKEQDQVDLSGHQSPQPLLSYACSCQPRQRPYDSPPSSPEPLSGGNIDSLEAGRRWNPCGHGCEVDATDTISSDSQFQLHQRRFSVGNCKSHQSNKKPCNCRPTRDQSQHSHQCADKFTANVEHSHIPLPNESSVRRKEVSQAQCHLHQPSVNCSQQYQTQHRSCLHIPNSGRQLFSQSVAAFNIINAGNCAHHKHDKPSCCYGHQLQPQMETCRDVLSSRKPLTNSAKPHAGVEIENGGEFRSPPLPESMIRYNKRAPTKYLLGHVTDDRQQQVEGRGLDQSSSLMLATSDEPHEDLGMDGSDEFLSPPPVESMIRCTKRRPAVDPAHVTPDIINDQLREEISPVQVQPQKGHSKGPESSSQSQPSHPQAPLDMFGAVPSEVKKKTRGRGPTRCLDVWNCEDKIPVSTNEFGEPIGPEAPKFIFFLGTIARNGHIAPLNYIHWKAVPDENKERMWQLVESKFLIDPQSKGSILKSIGTKWKNWKALLKAKHYNSHETDEERLADCNERVQPDQWRILVSFWNSTEAKVRSNTNKANRLKFTSNHACGSKSFARVREEQRQGGKEPSQADLFIATRTRKNGQPVNETSSVIISQLRDAAQQQGITQKDTIADDVFVQVVGEETLGRVHTPGVGSTTLSKLNTSKPLPVEAVRMVSEAKAEVREMREKMVSMEQTCAQMAAQIATMMTMMQKNFSDKDPPNGDASQNSERSEHSLSSNHGVSSLQGSRTRSGKK